MEFTKKVYCEKVDVVIITALYTEQSDDVKEQLWEEVFFNLMNSYNNSSSSAIIEFTMRQGCRDANGFYPNYYYLVVEKGHEDRYISWLEEGCGYKIKYRDAKKLKIMLDWSDDIYNQGLDGAYLDIE